MQASFRGVPFYLEESSNGFGRRVVLHEYPQFDIPYAEDLGRKARTFNLNGYVIGDDWEQQRNRLIKACEDPNPGTLVHPDYSQNITVVCESLTVTESKQNAKRIAKFSFNFVETGENKTPILVYNSAARIRQLAVSAIVNLANIFITNYRVTHLPNYVTNYVAGFSNTMTSQVRIPVYTNNITDAIDNINNADYSEPYGLPQVITQFTSSFNRDYSFDAVCLHVNEDDEFEQFIDLYDQQTDTYNAKTAQLVLIRLCNIELSHINPLSDIKQQQYIAGRQFELFFKSCLVIEASIAASLQDYESLQQAQVSWQSVLDIYENLINISAELDDNKTYIELRQMRAVFQADIHERAPLLSKLIYKKYETPTSSLLIAHENYEDISRSYEIVKRNSIRHPGYIVSNNLELLNE